MFIFLSIAASADAVKLNSPRNVSADVSKKEKSYIVNVKFLPVTTLDKVTNAKMTETAGRFFIAEALSVYLKADMAVDFSRVHLERTDISETRCSFICSIPFSAVHNAVKLKSKTGKNVGKSLLGTSLNSSLFTESEIFMHDLKFSESVFLDEISRLKGDPGKLIRQINQSFDAMTEKIEQKDNLLTAEKEEFILKANKVRAYLLKKLGTVSSSAEKNTEKNDDWQRFVKNPFFRENFKPYLINDTILLQMGGCRALRNDKGEIVIIAAAHVSVSGKSPGTMKELARIEAFQMLARQNSLQVKSSWKIEEDTAVQHRNGVESSNVVNRTKYIAEIKSAAYIHGMTDVAQWFSADGKTFFLAVGKIINQENIGE